MAIRPTSSSTLLITRAPAIPIRRSLLRPPSSAVSAILPRRTRRSESTTLQRSSNSLEPGEGNLLPRSSSFERRKKMKDGFKHRMITSAAVLALAASCAAQVVASHAPTAATAPVRAAPPAAIGGNPVARVNGAVLTDRDLTREIQAIFPYAQTHNGVPKSMEPEVRKGALDMIIFEELVYQEALRRKMTVSPERMKKAEREFRKQFISEQEFIQVLQIEVHG